MQPLRRERGSLRNEIGAMRWEWPALQREERPAEPSARCNAGAEARTPASAAAFAQAVDRAAGSAATSRRVEGRAEAGVRRFAVESAALAQTA